MNEIRLRGKLLKVIGKDTIIGEKADYEAEILFPFTPPSQSDLENLKEGDEVIVRAVAIERFGASVKVMANNSCKDDIYFVRENIVAILPQSEPNRSFISKEKPQEEKIEKLDMVSKYQDHPKFALLAIQIKINQLIDEIEKLKEAR